METSPTPIAAKGARQHNPAAQRMGKLFRHAEGAAALAHVRYISPLRYPGGKAKLAKYVQTLLEKNGLTGGHYVEAYAGGASVALALLFRGCVAVAHINDLDPAVFAFWHSVLFETERLCRLIRSRRVSIAEWHRQRAVQLTPEKHTLIELGFSTFFLNRTNRSGIIRSGGMIGGAKQAGIWKLDARYNKSELITRIERVAAHRERIRLYKLDAVDLLRTLLPQLPKATFVYLDPPYYIKGRRRLYTNFYEHGDHADIAAEVGAIRTPWLVSYDDQPEIRRLYRAFQSAKYSLTYTASARYQGSEVLFFSDNLVIPAGAHLQLDKLNLQRTERRSR